MKQLLLGCALLVAFAAHADEAATCSASAGAYRTGVVVMGPKFSHGQFRKGVELSHTHLKMKSDQDGKVYDVAIDNVFASGFEPNQRTVPTSLSAIKVNDRVEACGQLYTDGGVGIHWVHTNCGKKPTPNKPDGWLKVISADGQPGQNIESNTQYCSVFK
ncbi:MULTISPECIES: hypothetical protein [unclassified Duganella]|uniref:hypothetical protein n=1 Tax=unclassified Duganella TaxID=2636909 RepID=UPI000E34F009|nr:MULTISPECIES: hypothetical protein [unclassified Duganella]RFP15838.1 hypothetical protein D0T23_07985 [Duganella sp. BJB475]RFP32998.1 hypothetical protein D0T21_12645 [Duganella sp. BJB476]